MARYKLSNFLGNLDDLAQDMKTKERNHAIGGIVASLQQPMKNVLNSIVTKQVTDLEVLLKQINWKQ